MNLGQSDSFVSPASSKSILNAVTVGFLGWNKEIDDCLSDTFSVIFYHSEFIDTELWLILLIPG